MDNTHDCYCEDLCKFLHSFDMTILHLVMPYLRHPFRRPAAATFPEGEGFL